MVRLAHLHPRRALRRRTSIPHPDCPRQKRSAFANRRDAGTSYKLERVRESARATLLCSARRTPIVPARLSMHVARYHSSDEFSPALRCQDRELAHSSERIIQNFERGYKFL